MPVYLRTMSTIRAELMKEIIVWGFRQFYRPRCSSWDVCIVRKLILTPRKARGRPKICFFRPGQAKDASSAVLQRYRIPAGSRRLYCKLERPRLTPNRVILGNIHIGHPVDDICLLSATSIRQACQLRFSRYTPNHSRH